MAGLPGQVARGSSLAVTGVSIRSGLEQDARGLGMAAVHGEVQGGAAAVVALVDRRPCLEQNRDQVGATVDRGDQQGREAVLIAKPHVGAARRAAPCPLPAAITKAVLPSAINWSTRAPCFNSSSISAAFPRQAATCNALASRSRRNVQRGLAPAASNAAAAPVWPHCAAVNSGVSPLGARASRSSFGSSCSSTRIKSAYPREAAICNTVPSAHGSRRLAPAPCSNRRTGSLLTRVA